MAPFIRILVQTHHAAVPGMGAYEATALDISMAEGHVDHTCLAAAGIVRNLQSMYAGDHVSVAVTLSGRVERRVASSGIMGRHDDTIEGMCIEIERWGG